MVSGTYKFSYYYSLLSSGFKPLKVEANQWFSNKNTGGINLYPSTTGRLHQFEYSSSGNLFIGLKRIAENLKINKTINSLGI
jgi:hypothetical protein